MKEIPKFKQEIHNTVDYKTEKKKLMIFKSGWFHPMKSGFIGPLVDISTDNRSIIGFLGIKISQIANEFVAYVDSFPNSDKFKNVINDTTKFDVKSIVEYASQFKLPVNKAFLRTSFFDGSSDKTGYIDLLKKNRKNIENLDDEQIREITKLTTDMKLIVSKSKTDVWAAYNQCIKSFKTFTDATIQIGLALRLMDNKVRLSSFDANQVAEHTKKLHANIEICKNQMSNKAHSTDLEVLKKKLDEANAAQIHLPSSIEKIFKATKLPEETNLPKGKSLRKSFGKIISSNSLQKAFKTVLSLKQQEKAKAFLLKTPIQKFIR